jgi:TonB-linked SusC/RagA family outer membrane protein
VYLPELSLGSLTNADGRFLILSVPAGTFEVRVDLIGYSPGGRSVTVVGGGSVEVDFELSSTALRLQELVVTGVAGRTPRVKLPFTVEKLDSHDMPVPTRSIVAMLAGKLPGAKIVRGSGQPGTDASILLRGPTSIIGGQHPLVIVDGVPTFYTLADLSALDVESIEIVKGAAAASVYGSWAHNGVVQIRTRRGATLGRDESRVMIRSDFGHQSLERRISKSRAHWFETNADGDILDVQGNIVRDLLTHTESTGNNIAETKWQDKPYPDYMPLYDHVDQFFDPGHYMSQHAAVEGRTGSTNYRASFTYQDDEGILPDFNDGAQLKGFRLNMDHQVSRSLRVGLSTYYAQTDREDLGGNPFGALVHKQPFVDLLRRDSSTIGLPHCPQNGCLAHGISGPISNEENPLYSLELIDRRTQGSRFLGNANVRWSPLPWMELEGNFSLDRYNRFHSEVIPRGYQFEEGEDIGTIRKDERIDNDAYGSLTASINKAFGDLTTRTRVRYFSGDHHQEMFQVTGKETRADRVPVLDNTASFLGGSHVEDIRVESVFFISALDYRGKYIGDIMVRRDGCSLFGPKERWQNYYRASSAWRVAQEGWWPFETIGELKLRYSLGTAGGRPRFAAQYETYSVTPEGVSPMTLGNKRLKPELAIEHEAGLEAVFFHKVSAGVVYAQTTIEDQFLERPLLDASGFTHQWINGGTLKSNTIEAWMEMALIDTPGMTWTSRLNFDRTRQKITRLDVPPYRTGFFYVREGEVMGTFYGNRWATECGDLSPGIPCEQFQLNDDGLLVWVGDGGSWKDGMAKDLWGTKESFLDANGKEHIFKWGLPIKSLGVSDAGSETTFLYMGSTTPDFNLSWSNHFRWRNLTLFALLDGEFGADVYNETRQFGYRDGASGDQDQLGKPDCRKKPLEYYGVLYNVNANNSWYVEDGTFVKLREISLRYTFSPDRIRDWFSGALGLTGLAIDIVGQNLFTWTHYRGYDPEVGLGTWDAGGGSPAVGRVDSFQYPNFRTISLSLEARF